MKTWNPLAPNLIGLLLILLSQSLLANERYDTIYDDRKTLFFDHPPVRFEHLEFDQKSPIKPSSNDFQILEISYLSNKLGERWALVTLKNRSSGQRLIDNEYIVATFADGSQAYAKNLDARFSANEILTRSIFFGVKAYPIVRVSTEK